MNDREQAREREKAQRAAAHEAHLAEQERNATALLTLADSYRDRDPETGARRR